MSTTGISQTIERALQHEQRTAALSQNLEQQLPTLQEHLLLPEQEPVAALMRFIVSYVESVPGSLRLVTAVSKQLGFYDYAAPFLNLAEDYFIQPPEVLPQDGGLEALLDEAFLAHRLLEEVNDHHIKHMQQPLLPLDMTEASLIVHHLLGDRFATRLEQLVQLAANQLLQREHVWERLKSLPGAANLPDCAIQSESLMTGSNPVRLRLRKTYNR